MSEHTPGPWKAVEHNHETVGIYGADGRRIGCFEESDDVSEEESVENARRTLACVNACEGINPEAVPDLLAACEALLANADAQQEDQAACRRLYNAWRSIREAVAKAKVQS